MDYTKNEIEDLEHKFKLNLINSISGIKPANLIATESKNGISNVAIFSSVVHLGSSPAQLGFILRPFEEDEPRDTFRNILESGYYSINHISESFMENAHYTSAKLDSNISEFEEVNLEKEYIKGFQAPFVKASPVKIGMKFLQRILLPNKCSLIIGEIELISMQENALNDLGEIDLGKNQTVGISGLNTYYNLKKLTSYPYVRKQKKLNFNK